MINCKTCRNTKNCVYAGADREMEECVDRIPTTHSDLIRSMTDEDLAEWINEWFDCGNCAEFFGNTPCSKDKDCIKVWLEWLKQEVKE